MSALPFLALLTMVAFAANSWLARAALAEGLADPAGYTAVRLVSGAVVLALLVMRRSGAGLPSGGNWPSALMLFVYAAGFSFAYLSLDTGTGALILFACVQATMLGVALWRGDRPGILEWAGLAVAFAAFVWLVSPGVSAPEPTGAVLMVAAGIAWGVYSLRGAGAADPLAMTAGNFVRASAFGVALAALFITSLSMTALGAILAITSGAITSGLGYALWYRVLREITTTQAAILQLSVPAIAALMGVAFLGEEPTLRLIIACPLILGGVAVAVLAKRRR